MRTATDVQNEQIRAAASRLSVYLEGMNTDHLLPVTLETPGPQGEAVRAMVRLSRNLTRFAWSSRVDDADWHPTPHPVESGTSIVDGPTRR